jgi:Uma2 family endonuclease
MATARTPSPRDRPVVEYPTGDGKPLAETPTHRDNLLGTIQMLRRYFRGDHSLHISGNMTMYYVEGDKRRHVSPDVFVTLGIGDHNREAYLTWEAGKGPDFVVEVTSKSTKREDLKTKFSLYQDVLEVREYFLFDPYGEYLKPPLQGYRRSRGKYTAIEPINGRLPSEVVGLHLERDGSMLRLYDPKVGSWVMSDEEAVIDAEEKAARRVAIASTEAAQRIAAASAEAEGARAEAEGAAPKRNDSALRCELRKPAGKRTPTNWRRSGASSRTFAVS